MNKEQMLESTDASLLVIEERTHKDIVVGVPHHAPAGQSTLPCPEHKDADENAGFLGQYLADRLDCCSIIACNYTCDVNKSSRSDYSRQIASWEPKVLVEIHGHSGKNAKHNIEVSSGSSRNNRFSKALSEKLQTALSADEDLELLSVCGEYDKLFFKASKAVTISDGRWIAYHIELPSQLRKSQGSDNGKPPDRGYCFCDILCSILHEIHRDGNNHYDPADRR
jgi:hypothetical protein